MRLLVGPLLITAALGLWLFWPQDRAARHGRSASPADEPPATRASPPWLIAVDPAGHRLRSTMTAEDGLCVIRCPGFVTEAYLPRRDDPRPLTITLTPAVTWRGRVVLGDIDHPAAGVRVSAWGWPEIREAVTDPDGRFALPDLNPAHTLYPEFELLGYAPPDMRCHVRDHEVLVVLGDHGTLRGEVVDAAGRPVAGMTVLLLGEVRSLRDVDPESFAVVTGDDGRFAFHDLEGEEHRVVARDATRRGETEVIARRTCTVMVSEHPRLRVRITGPRGTPVEHARVWVEEESPRDFPAADRGVYASGPLSLGAHTLHVAADGWPERAQELELVRVGEREVDLRLEDAHTLRAQVVDDTGQPVEGARVHLEAGITDTDAQGRFVVRGLAAAPSPSPSGITDMSRSPSRSRRPMPSSGSRWTAPGL